MRTVGFVATAMFALLVVGGLAVFLRSLPDIARYLRLRRM